MAFQGFCHDHAKKAAWNLPTQVVSDAVELFEVSAVEHEVETSVAELVREADSNATGRACDEGPRRRGIIGAAEVARERGRADMRLEKCGYFEG